MIMAMPAAGTCLFSRSGRRAWWATVVRGLHFQYLQLALACLGPQGRQRALRLASAVAGEGAKRSFFDHPTAISRESQPVHKDTAYHATVPMATRR